MTVRTVTVSGMTCDHCVRAVQGELGRLEGVSDVQVELASGRVTITSDTPVADDALVTAVAEAGYEVVP